MPEAEQLVFTRVEAAFSPTRDSGYQTVYRSAGLSPDDVAAIEDRVSAFAGAPGQVRTQFFRLTNERAVVTRSEKLVNVDRKIVDRNGRPGPFIAHGVVVRERDLAKFGHNPFAVIDSLVIERPNEEPHRGFFTDPVDAVGAFDKAFEEAPPARWGATGALPEPQWSEERRANWCLWAAQAEQTVGAGRSLALTGEPDQVEEALRVAFARLSLLRRSSCALNCTFDTLVKSKWPAAGEFWALGSPDDPPEDGFTPLDPTDIPEPPEGPGNGLYFRWWRSALTRLSADETAAMAPGLELLADCHEGRTEGTDAPLDSAWGEFRALFPDAVQRELRRRVAPHLRARLSPVLDRIAASAGTAPDPWWLRADVRTPLARELAEWYASARPRLRTGDRQALRQLARETGTWALLFWLSFVGWRARPGDRAEALQNMDKENFQRCLMLLGDPIEPETFVCAEHALALVSALVHRRTALTVARYLSLSGALLRVGAVKEHALLAKYVAEIGPGGVLRWQERKAST